MAHNQNVVNHSEPFAGWNPPAPLTVMPISQARLSGGSPIRGPYDFETGAPADGNYFQGANSPATLNYIGAVAQGNWPANDDSNQPYTTIRLLSPTDLQEFYISFKFRFPAWADDAQTIPNVVWGHKMCKPVGRNNGSGTHNMTCGPNYDASHAIERMSFGDGSSTSGDTAQQIPFDRAPAEIDIGRGWPTFQSNTPNGGLSAANIGLGDTWHEYKAFFRFNSGESAETETPDGAFCLFIDDVLICDAAGFFNRHYSNSLFFDGITLFGTMQNHSQAVRCEIDDVIVSTDGWT